MGKLKQIKNITIGSDPEIFIVDKLTNVLIPSYTFLKGSKDKSQEVEGVQVLCDNVMLEFNINPCRTGEGLAETLTSILKTIQDKIIPNGTAISQACSISIPKAHLKDAKALEFGCSPDFNAWDMSVNRVTKNKDASLRSSGGHLHLGYEEPDDDVNLEMLRIFDLFLGLPSIEEDKDTKRRELYGKAGAFRFTSYGFEYRVLSNYWIFSPETIQSIYTKITKAISYYNEGNRIDPKSDIAKMIIEAINSQNKDLADRTYKKALNIEIINEPILQIK